LADEEFVDEDPKGPPVDGGAVARVADDLGREILGRSAECICFSCEGERWSAELSKHSLLLFIQP
jgi:hypothetical protein